jgi:NAD(P)H-nitrite reductase large subunit
MAGVRALEEILSRAPHEFSITVFGAEPHGNYNRIMLSPVLAGEKTFEAITTHPRSWYEENSIELIAGEPVVGIDREAKTVTGEFGTTRPYDVLLLATGSNPVIIPLPGHKLPGVIGFRDIADVETMVAASKSGTRAVVIGGGLLGLEAANGLARNSMDTTVPHIMPTLMERQLDPVSAGLLKADLGNRGIKVITEANTKVIVGEERVEGVTLADGTHLPASIVVMAAGIRPNIALAKEAGLACGRGIQVDDAMVTSDPAIYAVGECVEHRGALFGLVAPLYEMAKIVADRVTKAANSNYVPAHDWRALAASGGNIAAYMATKTLRSVAASLIDASLPGSTPAVAVENASRSNEAYVHGTLATLPDLLEANRHDRTDAGADWRGRCAVAGDPCGYQSCRVTGGRYDLYNRHAVPGVQRGDLVSLCQRWIVKRVLDKIIQRAMQVQHRLADMHQFSRALTHDMDTQ